VRCSDGEGDYGTVDCFWRIRPARAPAEITLRFVAFQLEEQ
jgi:hypothetical protein